MLYAPTHVVDVLTGTSTDALGDVTDGTTVAAANVPVSLIERTRRVYREDSQTPGTVRFTLFRAPAGTPVAQGDRLRHNATGQLWAVDGITAQANPFVPADITGECRRVQ